MSNHPIDSKIEELRKENRWQGIIDYLKPVVDAGEEQIEYFKQLGFAYSQLDHYDKARYYYKLWIETEPHRAQPYYSMGYTYYDAGKWTEAIKWFDKALEIYPDYIVCHYRKGVAEFNMQYSKKAKESFTKAINAYNKIAGEKWHKIQAKYFIKSVFYLGKTYYDLSQYNNALSCFKKVNQEDKRSYLKPDIKRYNLAKGYFGVGKYLEAERILLELTKNKYAKNYIYALLGRVQAAANEYDKAFFSFENALKRKPDSYIFVYKAQLNEIMGRNNDALKDYEDALQRDRKGKHKILLALGKLAMKSNRCEEAKNFFLRAIEFKKKLYNADYYSGHLALADCYRMMGEDGKSKEEYRIAETLMDIY